MTAPIVFVSRNRVKAGRLDEFRKHYQASIASTQAGKPGTLAQMAYENEDATQVIVVRFFPSADALDQQLQGADERSKRAYEYIEPLAIEIYGRPNPATLEKMLEIAGSGITVLVHPRYIGGFIR